MSLFITKREPKKDDIPCNVCRNAEGTNTNPLLDIKTNSASDNVDISVVAAVHRNCLKAKMAEAK